jgi:hypothetical protein
MFFSVCDASIMENRCYGDLELVGYDVPPFISKVPKLELLSFGIIKLGARSAFSWF